MHEVQALFFLFLALVLFSCLVLLSEKRMRIFLDKKGMDCELPGACVRVNFFEITAFTLRKNIFLGRYIVLRGEFCANFLRTRNPFFAYYPKNLRLYGSKKHDLDILFAIIRKNVTHNHPAPE